MADAVDWATARRVALRFSARNTPSAVGAYHNLSADMAELTEQAEELVTAETGLVSSAGPARARVVNRAMWIDANIASFQRLLGPLMAKLESNVAKSGRMKGLTAKVGGSEVGVVLGWMSGRVLGQYDLLITEDDNPEDQDIVYYVGPNLLGLEHKFDFEPREFRLWLALHECTHRAQFTGVPWMREHFLSLVNETLDAVDPDPKRMMEAVKDVLEARRRGEDVLADGGIAGVLATPEQRVVLEKVSGLMSLLEGHGDVTMDRAGAAVLPSAPHFAKVLRERRNSAKGVTRLFQRLIGIEAKLNQYAAGEAFIEAVEKVGGPALVSRAFEAPENLPTMPEIRDPSSWVDRIQPAAALTG